MNRMTMKRIFQSSLSGIVIHSLVAALSLTAPTARAAESSPSSAEVYQAECGSCHTAYPSRLLKPAEWAAVVAALDSHYGMDASLDAETLAVVSRHLGVSARTADPVSTTPLPRITRSRWFLDEHDEVAAATFESPAVRSAANCSACHAGADRGDFDDDSVRIPK